MKGKSVNLSAMEEKTTGIEGLSNLRIKSTLGVGVAALFILIPFTMNNFYQGRLYLGGASLFVVVLCVFNAWYCIRDHYRPSLMFWGMVPAVIYFLVIAFQEQGVVSAFWCYPALVAFYFMLPEKKAWITNVLFIAIIFPQAWVSLEFPIFMRFIVTMLGVSAFSAIFVRVIDNQQKILEQHATTDPLTGLLNRALLNETMENFIQQSRRMGAPLTLIELDIDHFKMVNDKYGHEAGDRVLHGFGEFLRNRFRGTDKVFRIGGEEFLVVLFNTDKEAAVRVAEELRAELEVLPLLSGRSITASMGVASLFEDETQQSWMKRCDDNLYRAKENGRNQVAA